MSHVWMSHVSHVNESCLICKWVMSNMWMSPVTYLIESCHIFNWVMSHMWMSDVSYVNESCLICAWVMTHTSMCHASYVWEFVNELCMSHMCMSHVSLLNAITCHRHISHVSHVNTSCHKLYYILRDVSICGWVMSHIWIISHVESCLTCE